MKTECLSYREQQIAAALALGKTRKEIGNDLNISPGTAVVHAKNIYEKTGCHNLADITRHVIAESLEMSVEQVNEAVHKYLVRITIITLFLSIQGYIIYIDNQQLVRARTCAVRPNRNSKTRQKDTFYYV
jgi:DNA-binding CsgD family transcriptional regulator